MMPPTSASRGIVLSLTASSSRCRSYTVNAPDCGLQLFKASGLESNSQNYSVGRYDEVDVLYY